MHDDANGPGATLPHTCGDDHDHVRAHESGLAVHLPGLRLVVHPPGSLNGIE